MFWVKIIVDTCSFYQDNLKKSKHGINQFDKIHRKVFLEPIDKLLRKEISKQTKKNFDYHH
jgi:hypothetical protein